MTGSPVDPLVCRLCQTTVQPSDPSCPNCDAEIFLASDRKVFLPEICVATNGVALLLVLAAAIFADIEPSIGGYILALLITMPIAFLAWTRLDPTTKHQFRRRIGF